MPSWTPNDYDKVVQTLTPAPAAALTIDVYAGSEVILLMPAGNVSIAAIINAHAGDILTLKVVEDSVGSRSITAVPANVKRAAGAFALTAAANSVDQISFRYDGTNWNELGRSLNQS
jgi:hypothetical protein